MHLWHFAFGVNIALFGKKTPKVFGRFCRFIYAHTYLIRGYKESYGLVLVQ